MIVAAYRDPQLSSELYILEDGQANAVRARVRQELRCPFQDCPRPDFTTVSRSGGRDGFRHLAGAQRHSPESVNHIQGKAVLARHLSELFGPGSVSVESAVDTQRSRVADVLLTLPTAQRVAFEIQYSSLTVAEWRARHDSYRAAGIVDVWLWGHTYAPTPTARELVFPAAIYEAYKAGLPALFINPEQGQIGIAIDPNISPPVAPTSLRASVCATRIDEWTVDSEGLRSGTLTALRHATAKHLATEEERRRRERDARNARAAEQLEQRRLLREASPQRPVVHLTPSVSLPPARPSCPFCALPLAEQLAKNLGRHVRCGPGATGRR